MSMPRVLSICDQSSCEPPTATSMITTSVTTSRRWYGFSHVGLLRLIATPTGAPTRGRRRPLPYDSPPTREVSVVTATRTPPCPYSSWCTPSGCPEEGANRRRHAEQTRTRVPRTSKSGGVGHPGGERHGLALHPRAVLIPGPFED